MEADCNTLREDVEAESARAPWLPQVSKGAKMVLEQWLCALAQEAAKKAHAVRGGCGSDKHEVKRLNRKHMQIGWDVVFENVFSNTAMMPKTMFVAPVMTKKVTKKKSGKSKEAEAEGDDEDYAEEEAPAADEE